MASFQITRDRDAFFVLRGFRYQIDHAVLRWLTLQPHEILELERGEDLDVVARSVTNRTSEFSRQLQQIKHLQRPITLRSPSTVEAIANAIEHRATNVELRLSFAFLTNSCPTTERSSPFVDSRPGIEVWESLRKEEFTASEIPHRLVGLLSILRDARKPRSLSQTTWNAFSRFVKTADHPGLHDFICSFEWCTGRPNSEGMAQQVRDSLVSQGFSSTLSHATDLHARLFLHVIQLISTPGRKQLERVTLDQLAGLPSIGKQEQAILNYISSEVFRLDEKVATLSDRVEHQQMSIAHILQELYVTQNVSTQLSPQLSPLSTCLPPKVQLLSNREETIANLIELITDRTWLSIYGSMGVGKTHLTTLLAETLRLPAYHLSLRDLSASQSYLQLCKFFAQIGNAAETSTYEELIKNSLTNIGPRPAIIVDDLPFLDGHDQFSNSIVELSKTLTKVEGRLITTSYHAVPAEMLEKLPKEEAVNVISPAFSDREALELFDAHGAPATFKASGTVQLINLFTQGNASLLAAYARSLSARHWTLDTSEMQTLQDHEHAFEVIDGAIRRLLQTVSDDASRELLYRLSLIIGQFSYGEIEIAANVPPAIDHPREKLTSLVGLWIEQRANAYLTVSPIVKPLSRSELAPAVKKRLFERLATHIVNRHSLNVLELGEAVHYTEQSGDYNRLGLTLISALGSANGLPSQQLMQLYFLSKPGANLSSEMDLGLRILLRSRQACLAFELGWSATELLDDMDRLMAQAGSHDEWAVYVASCLTLFPTATFDFEKSLTYLGNAIRLNNSVVQILKSSGKEFLSSVDRDVLSAPFKIWLNITSISSTEHVIAWIRFLQTLDDEVLHEAFAHDYAAMGSVCVVDAPWLHEQRKLIQHQEWQKILETCEEVIRFAEAKELELLWAAATRLKIIMLTENFNNLQSALEIANSVVKSPLCEGRTRFLICDAIGRQLFYKQMRTDAATWLREGLSADYVLYPVIAVRSFIELSRAIGESDIQEATRCARKAEEFGLSRPAEIPELEMAAVTGEVGLAIALEGALPLAYESFDDAAERLLACRDDTDLWKQRFVMFLNTIVFYASVVVQGKPPDRGASGEQCVQPSRGALMSPPEKCATYFDEQDYMTKGSVDLCTFLSMYAQAIGRNDRCAYWSLQGLEGARTHNLYDVVAMLGQHVFPSLVLDGQIVDAIELAFESFTATSYCQALGAKHLKVRESHATLAEILGGKPNEQWEKIEKNVIENAILPIALEIGRIGLTDRKKAESLATAVSEFAVFTAEGASSPELWQGVSRTFAAIFIDAVSSNQLRDQGNEALSEKYNVLHKLAYLGCSLVPDAEVETSAVCQSVVFWYLCTVLSTRAPAYSELAVPFLTDYWTHIFQIQRFRFNTPSFVERELDEAIAAPIEVRVQRVLSVILNGLRQTLPENLRQISDWIQGGRK
jgi:hypothetical protein